MGVDIRVVDIAEADIGATDERSRELLSVDDALRALAAREPRKAQIVELRFFGGLTLEEIAEVLGVAPITVSREWAKARAWLRREVTAEPGVWSAAHANEDPMNDERWGTVDRLLGAALQKGAA